MTRVFLVATLFGAAASSADAGLLGFASFFRTASNGNKVVDLVAVMGNANDRLLSVFNVQISNFFIQQVGTAFDGFRPDAASSTRSNIVDSFITIGVEGGAPYLGEYYASSATSVTCGFGSCWTGNSTTTMIGDYVNWFSGGGLGPDNVAESLSNFTGTRVNSNAAAAGGSFGVWAGHWVFPGATTSAVISITGSSRDGLAGMTVTNTTTFDQLPAPGAVALLLTAGAAGPRRRRS